MSQNRESVQLVVIVFEHSLLVDCPSSSPSLLDRFLDTPLPSHHFSIPRTISHLNVPKLLVYVHLPHFCSDKTLTLWYIELNQKAVPTQGPFMDPVIPPTPH